MNYINQGFEAKCREHWNRMGYSNPKRLKEAILEVFARNTDQHYAITGVYRLVIPDWDEIEKLVGYPEAGTELCLFICRQCQEFDQKYHPPMYARGSVVELGVLGQPRHRPLGDQLRELCPSPDRQAGPINNR
jgi:hypothetical protein